MTTKPNKTPLSNFINEFEKTFGHKPSHKNNTKKNEGRMKMTIIKEEKEYPPFPKPLKDAYNDLKNTYSPLNCALQRIKDSERKL